VEALAWVSIAVAIGSALGIAVDEMRRPQRMAVMNAVWPLSALYLSLVALIGYGLFGRSHARGDRSEHTHGSKTGSATLPFSTIAIATSHCGAGCALADIACGFWISAAGIELFGSPLWAEYAIDLGAAWLVGIRFQYFAIKPMRDISAGQAIVLAVKADTLSILAFQIGMYGWMALVYFVFFAHHHLTAFDPRYWLMMQVGMVCGFATSFQMNRWLLRVGLKEAM
jgi:hypothetical protein